MTTISQEMCRLLDVEMPPLDPDSFLGFAFPGQPSVPHLAEFIHIKGTGSHSKKRVDKNCKTSSHQADDSRQNRHRSGL